MSTLEGVNEGMEGLDLQGTTNIQLLCVNKYVNIVLHTVFIHFK